jgi:hypothetical protein
MNSPPRCPKCRADCLPGARFCSVCGAAMPPGLVQDALPAPPDPLIAPPPGSLPQYSQSYAQQYQPPAARNEAGYGIVPYKNGQALGGYYMGCLSFILPVLAPVAVILGILGLRRAQHEPGVKGQVHAVIGIISGLLAAGLWMLLAFSWSSY